MALPDYFQRNAQAAAALVQGFDASLLAARLEREVVGVAFDAAAARSKEGQAAIDLTVRLLSRIYPALAIIGLEESSSAYLKKVRALARSINPRVDLMESLRAATKLLVFGRSPVKTNRRMLAHTWYLGSDNWFALLSQGGPVGSGDSANPLGAGAAACIGAANVFRAVFAEELGSAVLDSEVRTSLLDLRAVGPESANPDPSTVVLSDVHLVGAGAIGNGILWALGRMPVQGQLHIVDHETVSESNLQRYVTLAAGDNGKAKAALASEWLRRQRPGLDVAPHPKPWAEHVAAIPDHKVDTVLSAVDSAKARTEIQASLPRLVFNAWTQRGEAGVSRHWFLGQQACLACLYLPTGKSPSEDVLVARALRLGEDDPTVREVRRRLQLDVPTERTFLERVATAAGVSVEKLAAFENRPLRQLYVEGVCGGKVMEFHQAALQVRAEVPMAFQSAFAGILLAAELARPAPLEQTIAQIDLLSNYPERPGYVLAKTTSPQCLCLDEDFIEVFRAKYGPSNPLANSALRIKAPAGVTPATRGPTLSG